MERPVFRRTRGFTLAELLVVLAILVILAGILFPVFQGVRASAQRAVCLSNFRQTTLAATLYISDYDDRFMPANYRPNTLANSRNDRTWVQLLLPYERSFALFRCPADTGVRDHIEATFDQDLVPGDTESRYYSASQRSNIGYNYLYLSPIMRPLGGHWAAFPRLASMVGNPSNTVMFVDSVWDRDAHGVPFGGGNYLVVPPCRFVERSGQIVDTFRIDPTSEIFTPNYGWKVNSPYSGQQFGGAWPWHRGHMNIARVDGSARSLTPTQLAAGCQIRNDWEGKITSPGNYGWDLN
ncbi:MAG: DUF1559 domain-containing protein [Fimbriimonadaceae bacterium]|nr:DUF1559 domain-containing protein [Fimbriimonadaceae bacterium]